jgi:hypothetical protein
MSQPDLSMPGAWRQLFPSALKLMAHLEAETKAPVWTFGGGTVLMLRIRHRESRDIDLFVPDPQYLGYINPRLSALAEDLSTHYEENAEFIKLFLPHGEIDIVVGASLTGQPFDLVPYKRRELRIETSAEIIAKKMWHRGHRAKARDLFDLCAVAEAEPQAIAHAAPFMQRHGNAFLQQIEERSTRLQGDFEDIVAIDFTRSFAECVERAHDILGPLVTKR